MNTRLQGAVGAKKEEKVTVCVKTYLRIFERCCRTGQFWKQRLLCRSSRFHLHSVVVGGGAFAQQRNGVPQFAHDKKGIVLQEAIRFVENAQGTCRPVKWHVAN